MDRPKTPLVYLSGVFGAVWVISAWLRPDATFVMFPVLVAAAMPVAYRVAIRRPLPLPAALGAATAGLINVVVVASLLHWLGRLSGPRVWGLHPLLEASAIGVLGAVIGTVLAIVGARERS